jgi:hypothetical protein
MYGSRRTPNPKAGLWWAAVVTLLIGLSLSYVIHLRGLSPNASQYARLVLAVTITLVGVCVICATSGWWLRR